VSLVVVVRGLGSFGDCRVLVAIVVWDWRFEGVFVVVVVVGVFW
jgi:hypothetical protein